MLTIMNVNVSYWDYGSDSDYLNILYVVFVFIPDIY